MKTESVRMHNAKYELLRHFNSPEGATDSITRLQRLVVEGMMDWANEVNGYHHVEANDLHAAAWLADLAKIVHDIEILESNFEENYSPGEKIKEKDLIEN